MENSNVENADKKSLKEVVIGLIWLVAWIAFIFGIITLVKGCQRTEVDCYKANAQRTALEAKTICNGS